MRQTPRHLAVRRIASASVAVLALGGLAACGDDSSGDDTATDSTSQVAGETEDDGADAAEVAAGDEVDAAEFVKTVTDGLEASTTAHMTLAMDLGSAGEMNAEGDIDYSTNPPQMAMTMASPMGGGGDMDIRMVDGIMYLSMGELTEGKFIKIDPADPKGPLAGLGMEGMLDQLDPGKALASMEQGIDKVVFVGEEDGQDHYELTVDLAQLADQMGGLPPAAGAEMPESVTYDLWLDDEGRFTKMSMDELPVGGATGSMEMTVSGWGEEVDIEAPSADQITEMPDFGSMMQGSGAA